jgi:hypothetical protein
LLKAPPRMARERGAGSRDGQSNNLLCTGNRI